jgi:RNA methyltransferase, TrmH family
LAELKITSVRNPRVQAAYDLRERRERLRQGRILIDGVRELGRALAASVKLIEVFACRELLATDAAQALVEQLAKLRIPLVDVSPHVFEKLAYGERTEGVLAVAETPSATLDNLRLPDRPLVAVLEACEKPGNLGAILRTADGAGLSAVIVADGRTDLFNPNVLRASLGTIFSVPVAAASAAEVRSWLLGRGISIVAAQVDAPQDYTAIDLTGPTAIVLGNEAHGLSDVWRTADVTAVRLPMLGIADSLNVSVTAAVLFYEAVRQRQP